MAWAKRTPPPPPRISRRDYLSSLRKAELKRIEKALELDADSKATKDELVDLIFQFESSVFCDDFTAVATYFKYNFVTAACREICDAYGIYLTTYARTDDIVEKIAAYAKRFRIEDEVEAINEFDEDNEMSVPKKLNRYSVGSPGNVAQLRMIRRTPPSQRPLSRD